MCSLNDIISMETNKSLIWKDVNTFIFSNICCFGYLKNIHIDNNKCMKQEKDYNCLRFLA